MAFLIIMLISSTLFLGQLKPYFERFESIFTLQGKGASSTQKRIQIIKDAWDIFLEHPFGVGLYGFRLVRMEKFGRHQDTHNLYLEIATNLGIQGCVVWGVFIFYIFKSLFGSQKSAQFQIKRIKLLSINSGELDRKKYLDHLADLQAWDIS